MNKSVAKQFITIQHLCNKYRDKFVPLNDRDYKANEVLFKPTDKLDDYIVINTGASLPALAMQMKIMVRTKTSKMDQFLNLPMVVPSKLPQLTSFQYQHYHLNHVLLINLRVVKLY